MIVHQLDLFSLFKSNSKNNRCGRNDTRRGNCDYMIKIKEEKGEIKYFKLLKHTESGVENIFNYL